jgi:hypothetical protein
MKTKLPNSISTVEEAKVFLAELVENNEEYHPEDDATKVYFDYLPKEDRPTQNECLLLNRLMDDIYKLTEPFDPCEYILQLTHVEDQDESMDGE